MHIAAAVGMRLETFSGSRSGGSAESAHVAASGRGPRRGRILIMDDDRTIRETMRRQLAICGFEVVPTAHGEEALTAFLEAKESGRPFDVVILDLMVDDGWGGEQTLRELLRLDPAVRALVCSGSLNCSKAYYQEKGFLGALAKPYSLDELRGEIDALLPPQVAI